MWPPMHIETPRERRRRQWNHEQVRGAVMLAEEKPLLAKRATTDLDRTWAVRDSEQRQRQKKRDAWCEKMRPLLTRRKLVTMRTTGWEWT